MLQRLRCLVQMHSLASWWVEMNCNWQLSPVKGVSMTEKKPRKPLTLTFRVEWNEFTVRWDGDESLIPLAERSNHFLCWLRMGRGRLSYRQGRKQASLQARKLVQSRGRWESCSVVNIRIPQEWKAFPSIRVGVGYLKRSEISLVRVLAKVRVVVQSESRVPALMLMVWV